MPEQAMRIGIMDGVGGILKNPQKNLDPKLHTQLNQNKTGS